MTTKTWTVDEVRALGVRTDIETAGAILGMGRTKAHELARRGEFPCKVLRHGARYVVPVAGILRVLDLEDSAFPDFSGSRPGTSTAAEDSETPTPLEPVPARSAVQGDLDTHGRTPPRTPASRSVVPLRGR